MNTKLIAAWVKNLRSGKYKQGFQTLRTNLSGSSFGYCCLGVLCETAGLDWDKEYPIDEDMLRLKDKSVLPKIPKLQNLGFSNYGVLEKLKHWPIRKKDNSKSYFSLPAINDFAKLSFHMIADLIEYTLLKDGREDLIFESGRWTPETIEHLKEYGVNTNEK